MARLTVSIPQDLHNRLENWRDRLNISKVCQEALERELRRLEELPEDAKALGNLVERLSHEKADGERQWFSQGVSDGMTWARGASYVDLKAAADTTGPTPSVSSAIEDGKSSHSDVVGFDEDSYVAGWRFAAGEVWRRVATKI
ncbi:MAG: hypothetical protein ACRDZM_17895 [Acidimicrobiia bacterium]